MSSSQDFVRALRTGSDPPVEGGPSKIEFARKTWDDATFYVPEKAKVIAEWILSIFAKEKSATSTSNPLLDAHYWELLLDVISGQSPSSFRGLPAWLITLLNRLHLAPIVSYVLGHQKYLLVNEQQRLLHAFTSCISLIWRVPAAKMSAEALLDCLDAFWNVYLEGPGKVGTVAPLGILIAGSYRHAFANSSNKKKLYAAFTQVHLSRWLTALSLIRSPGDTLSECLSELGSETIFSIDMLRQPTEFGQDGAFSQALRDIERVEEMRQCLPLLLRQFINATRKHRGPLYGQSSQGASAAHEEHLGCVHFLNAIIKLTQPSPNPSQIWAVRRSLFKVVEDTNLLGRKSDEAAHVVEYMLDQALQDIHNNAIGNEVGNTALECITLLARIDFNFVLPIFSRLLSPLLMASPASTATKDFQDLSLDYFSKTRTMDTYLTTLFTTLRTQQFLIDGSDREALEALYTAAFSGPTVHPTYLRTLAGTISTFITAGQVFDIVKAIRQNLDDLWSALHPHESSNLKKSKGDQGQTDQAVLNSAALALSLSVPLASIILASLPYHTVPDITRQEVIDEVTALREFVTTSLRKELKTTRKADSWNNQVICTSLLRLQYAMETSISVIPPTELNSKFAMKLLELQSSGLSPDLTLEVFRTLLHYCATSGEQEHTAVIINAVLSYVETHYQVSGVTWSGESKSPSKAASAVALFYFICERWLPVIETQASDAHLERFIRLFVQGNSRPPATPRVAVDGAAVVAKVLHTASFWEYQRLRSTFSAYINQATLALEQLDASQTEPSKTPWTEATISAAQIYQLLLLVPVEYLSKSLKVDLVKRALIADIVLHTSRQDMGDLCQVATSIRVFLYRACEAVGWPDKSNDSARFVHHLVNSPLSSQIADGDYRAASSNLIEVFLREAARIASKGKETMLLECLQLFVSEAIHTSASNGFLLPAFIRLVKALAVHKPASFSGGVQHKLEEVFAHQRSLIFPHISAKALNQETLSAWRSISLLGSWLNAENEQSSGIGRQLIQKIATATGVPDQILIDVLATILQELHLAKGVALLEQWELILATYITTYSGLAPSAKVEMNEILGHYSKEMAVEEYAQVLEMTSLALSQDWSTGQVLPNLLQFAIILQGNHPQGTLKPIQHFVTRTIHSFLMNDVYTSGTQAIRLRALEFISQFCSEKASFLRPNDASAILTLFSKLLHPTADHDDTTTSEIFHSIVTILNLFIRLRRDLVATLIPHLSMVLRQLLVALRRCRPNLGVKQTRLVMDTLPRWIATTTPLGVDEAKALSRLLETVTVKTSIRNHTTTAKTQTQKATSLAKPFSKHSAHVLKAYIEALNDPLCSMPLDVRKELKPGLYALCSMMSDHSRDAVMVSGLDTGGKAVLKNLWKEYEKQRRTSTFNSAGKFLMLRRSADCLRSLSSRACYATVSQINTLSPKLPPPGLGGKEVIAPLLDQEILKVLGRRKTISLVDVVDQYSSNAGHVLNFRLHNESTPKIGRRPCVETASGCTNNEMVLVARCVKSELSHKITISSGFALEIPDNPDETLILTCAHTLEQYDSCDNHFHHSSEIQPYHCPETRMKILGRLTSREPVTRVASALPRSDLILLGCKALDVKTLPLTLYPAQKQTAVRAHLVAYHEPAEPGWHPWIGGTWRKWAHGLVLGHRDLAGREAEPGTYDALSHLFFTPLPTNGSSGGPLVDEETGAVVGIMLGTRMDSRIEGVKGWGVPSEVVYEMFSRWWAGLAEGSDLVGRKNASLRDGSGVRPAEQPMALFDCAELAQFLYLILPPI